MKIYHYDKVTKEYIGYSTASKDPIASKITGEFVPLIPAYSTTLEPPEICRGISSKNSSFPGTNPQTDNISCKNSISLNSITKNPLDYAKENKAAVFNIYKNKWEIEPDYRKNFKLVTTEFEVFDIKKIGEIKEGYLITNKNAELIKQNPNYFKIKNNEIIKKTEAEINAEIKEAKRQQQIVKIKEELADLDSKTIRPLRAGETDILKELETQAKILRQKLDNISNSINTEEVSSVFDDTKIFKTK